MTKDITAASRFVPFLHFCCLPLQVLHLLMLLLVHTYQLQHCSCCSYGRLCSNEQSETSRDKLRTHIQVQQTKEDIRTLLLPKDRAVDRGVILEVRAGTGGEEAALFASDLFNMYQRFAEQQR